MHEDGATLSLCRGMVSRTCIGRALGHSCFWRASQLFLKPGLRHAVLDTSQPMRVLYEHVGFVLREIVPGAHGHVWSSAGVTAGIDPRLVAPCPACCFSHASRRGFAACAGTIT